MQDLYLGSQETTSWSGARRVRLLDPVPSRGGEEPQGRWASLDPAGPAGLELVILAARDPATETYGRTIRPPHHLMPNAQDHVRIVRVSGGNPDV